MYEPLQTKSAVALLKEWFSGISYQQGADGVELVMPLTTKSGIVGKLAFPDRLEEYLVGLRLLRNIPLCYLVPDAALLPPESIRFFNVDYTWVDRVIDGVFASANTGTVDATFTYTFLSEIRKALDARLANVAKETGDTSNWAPGAKPMTGMLMRSAIVRRWPDMIVEAFRDAAGTQPAGLLRAEPISKDVYIALFAGAPQRVLVKEPFVGVRFGVEKEGTEENPVYRVDKRDADGKQILGDVTIPLTPERRMQLLGVAGQMGSVPRRVALHLEQRPYQQIFLKTIQEEKGSVSPLTRGPITLSRGRLMKLDKYVARFNQSMAMEKP